jgi:hypothetical protein
LEAEVYLNVDQTCRLLGYHAAHSGNFLTTEITLYVDCNPG